MQCLNVWRQHGEQEQLEQLEELEQFDESRDAPSAADILAQVHTARGTLAADALARKQRRCLLGYLCKGDKIDAPVVRLLALRMLQHTHTHITHASTNYVAAHSLTLHAHSHQACVYKLCCSTLTS